MCARKSFVKSLAVFPVVLRKLCAENAFWKIPFGRTTSILSWQNNVYILFTSVFLNDSNRILWHIYLLRIKLQPPGNKHHSRTTDVCNMKVIRCSNKLLAAYKQNFLDALPGRKTNGAVNTVYRFTAALQDRSMWCSDILVLTVS